MRITSVRAVEMKPNFALSLSFEGIALLHRAGAGWHLVGEVALDADDLSGDLAALRDKAAALDPAGFACKLILPNEQIKYLELSADSAPDGDLDRAVTEALDGATPYALDDLAYDWALDGDKILVAAVARETLDEAEAFGLEHEVNPICFVARPDDSPFPGEPFFGGTRHARDTLGTKVRIDRDETAVAIIGADHMPEVDEGSTPIADAPQASSVNPSPSKESAPEPPVIAFSSMRADREAEPGQAPILAGAARFTPTAPSAPLPDVPAPGPAPQLTGAADPALSALAAASLSPEPEAKDEDVAKAPRESGFLSRRKTAPTPAKISANSPDEAERLTIFGARAEQTVGGKPRYLGVILTAILLVVLMVIAAWAALFTDDGLAGVFRKSTPEIVATPTTPPAPTEDPVTEAANQPTPLPEAPSRKDAPVATALAPQPDEIAPEPELDVAETAPPVPAAELTPDQAMARYAATGIWQMAPTPTEAPNATGLDDFYLTSIDDKVNFQDAVALPDALDERADRRPETPASPAPPGTQFTIDPRGFVLATPGGALTPDGVLVRAGPPPRSPPDMPARVVPLPGVEQTAEALAEQQRLGEVRPRTRPDNLAEQQERGALSGRTRSELAALRPRTRPQSVVAAAANAPAAANPAAAASAAASVLDASAVAAALAEAVEAPEPEIRETEQAVLASLKPKTRPGNFDKIVRRSKPADTPGISGQTARRAAPSIPTTASVARQATARNAINLRNVNLIGVYGNPKNRRALVRLANGRYQKVQVGDRLNGGRVSAIGDTELRYKKSGRDVVLRMPKG
ncbi:hypothetical protein SAMN04487859_105177 [Roseovarius lutimaris]|uniref:Type IV pilus biogenesis protein PilP n=2 Tax=Roseovarius lutimaris TaxID=1005928 RepID=A0A1I5A9N9_9RHOB|nr:hypothetical protein SAMN04487859_105177 [Roseovarius lutimaris]